MPGGLLFWWSTDDDIQHARDVAQRLQSQITMTDFPASWQEANPGERSHDSRAYDTRLMLRLDDASALKRQDFVARFDVSKAAIIRQLIAQATSDDFPKSWPMRANERRTPQARQIVPR